MQIQNTNKDETVTKTVTILQYYQAFIAKMKTKGEDWIISETPMGFKAERMNHHARRKTKEKEKLCNKRK